MQYNVFDLFNNLTSDNKARWAGCCEFAKYVTERLGYMTTGHEYVDHFRSFCNLLDNSYQLEGDADKISSAVDHLEYLITNRQKYVGSLDWNSAWDLFKLNQREFSVFKSAMAADFYETVCHGLRDILESTRTAFDGEIKVIECGITYDMPAHNLTMSTNDRVKSFKVEDSFDLASVCKQMLNAMFVERHDIGTIQYFWESARNLMMNNSFFGYEDFKSFYKDNNFRDVYEDSDLLIMGKGIGTTEGRFVMLACASFDYMGDISDRDTFVIDVGTIKKKLAYAGSTGSPGTKGVGGLFSKAAGDRS